MVLFYESTLFHFFPKVHNLENEYDKYHKKKITEIGFLRSVTKTALL